MRLKKWCWLATETKNGWRLKFCADKDYAVTGALFTNIGQVKKVVGLEKIVFVHLKD
jgi:hypothetical protein